MFRLFSDPLLNEQEHGRSKGSLLQHIQKTYKNTTPQVVRTLRYSEEIPLEDLELGQSPELELKTNPSQELVRRRSTRGVLEEEVTRQKQRQEFYIRQINFRLRQVLSWPRYVPLDPYTETLGNACKDGILLCKLLNTLVPELVDERALNKHTPYNTDLTLQQMRQNVTLCITSAQAIGCQISIRLVELVVAGEDDAALEVCCAIMRTGLLQHINLRKLPHLKGLQHEAERWEQLCSLGPEALLQRWITYHLAAHPVLQQIMLEQQHAPPPPPAPSKYHDPLELDIVDTGGAGDPLSAGPSRAHSRTSSTSSMRISSPDVVDTRSTADADMLSSRRSSRGGSVAPAIPTEQQLDIFVALLQQLDHESRAEVERAQQLQLQPRKQQADSFKQAQQVVDLVHKLGCHCDILPSDLLSGLNDVHLILTISILLARHGMPDKAPNPEQRKAGKQARGLQQAPPPKIRAKSHPLEDDPHSPTAAGSPAGPPPPPPSPWSSSSSSLQQEVTVLCTGLSPLSMSMPPLEQQQQQQQQQDSGQPAAEQEVPVPDTQPSVEDGLAGVQLDRVLKADHFGRPEEAAAAAAAVAQRAPPPAPPPMPPQRSAQAIPQPPAEEQQHRPQAAIFFGSPPRPPADMPSSSAAAAAADSSPGTTSAATAASAGLPPSSSGKPPLKPQLPSSTGGSSSIPEAAAPLTTQPVGPLGHFTCHDSAQVLHQIPTPKSADAASTASRPPSAASPPAAAAAEPAVPPAALPAAPRAGVSPYAAGPWSSTPPVTPMQLRMSPAAHPNSSRLSVLGAGTLSPHNSGILPPSLPPAPAELSQERRYRSDDAEQSRPHASSPMPDLRRTISGNDHYQRSSGLSSVRQQLYLSHSQQLYKLHQAAMQQQDSGLQRRLAQIHSSIEAHGQDHPGVAMTASLPGHDRRHSSGGSDDGLIVIGDESCTSGRLPLLPAGRRGGSLSRRWSAAAEAAVAAARRSDGCFDGGDGDSDDGRDSQLSLGGAETDELQEERLLLLWANSLVPGGCASLQGEDMQCGWLLLQLVDCMEPGCVDWRLASRPPFKKVVHKIKSAENCSLAVRLCREVLQMPLVGIGGTDISSGSHQAILSLMWQLMRYHTMRQLSLAAAPEGVAGSGAGAGRVTEQDILDWANSKLAAGSKGRRLVSFSDPSLATSLPLLDLLECVAPGCIDAEYVEAGESMEQRRSNASYVISIARKLGCTLYLATEDLVAVRPRMVLLLLAALMKLDRGSGGEEGEAQQQQQQQAGLVL